MNNNIFQENLEILEKNAIIANGTTIFLTDGEERGPSHTCNLDELSSGKKSEWGKQKIGLDTRSFYKYRNNI